MDDSGSNCEICGKPMLKRQGRFGPFLGCSGYPICKNIRKIASSEQNVKSECKPLIEAATEDIYRHNAFRIMGLPVDATVRDVAKHADKLKMMEELGHRVSVHQSTFSLNPPPTLDQIREAIQKLKDPELRLIDEFFWFWPREFGKSASDPALQALVNGDLQAAYDIWGTYEDDPTVGVVATHNKALAAHIIIIALDWKEIRAERGVDLQRPGDIDSYWHRSSKRWERLLVDDRLWDRVAARVRQIDDARLTSGFVHRMRMSLPKALGKINAELALSYARAGKLELASLHIRLMRETGQGLDNAEKTAELVLTPVKALLKEQIARAKARAKKDPGDGAKVAKELLTEAQHAMGLFDLFLGKENDTRNDLFDEIATVCYQLRASYHKSTGDKITCLEIMNASLSLATSIDLRKQIGEAINALTGNIRTKKLELYELLKSIQEGKARPIVKLRRMEKEVLPGLMDVVEVTGAATSPDKLVGGAQDCSDLLDSVAVVLRGIGIDAWNQKQDIKTAVGAIRTALKYVRDTELRNRLQGDLATVIQLATGGMDPHLVVYDDFGGVRLMEWLGRFVRGWFR